MEVIAALLVIRSFQSCVGRSKPKGALATIHKLKKARLLSSLWCLSRLSLLYFILSRNDAKPPRCGPISNQLGKYGLCADCWSTESSKVRHIDFSVFSIPTIQHIEAITRITASIDRIILLAPSLFLSCLFCSVAFSLVISPRS